MAEKEFTIVNLEGLHARPAAKFVKLSNRYQSEIWVKKGDEEVNGKSIMGLMMLAAESGAKICISANGTDAEEAINHLGELIQSGFKLDP
jgi:phosphocarrier protein